MKKDRVLTAAVLALLAVLMLPSCGKVRHNSAPADNTGDTPPSVSEVLPSPPTPSPSASPASALPAIAVSPTTSAPALLKFEEKSLKSGVITIKYPQVFGLADSALQEKLNKFISDAALRDLPTIQGDHSLTAYELYGTVSFNNPELVSVYFEGYNNYVQAAHPNQFLYTVTVDVKNLRTVRLKDLVKSDKSFVETLLNGQYSSMSYDMTSDNAASIRSYLTEEGTDFWISELENADTVNHATASYLTKDALVVSVSVPHVMGDHVEIALPYKNLEKFKTGSPLWSALRNGLSS